MFVGDLKSKMWGLELLAMVGDEFRVEGISKLLFDHIHERYD